jgi:endonuclease/exonuclease/phosphatase family metal-dependent hydrolase
MIIAGDFNSVQHKKDCTGTPNPSRSLANLITGVDLTDAWTTQQGRPSYTHFTPVGANRIDRIYITRNCFNVNRG